MISEGGWRAFREASKAKPELEDEPAAPVTGDPVADAPGNEAGPDLGSDPDIAAWNSKDMKPDADEGGEADSAGEAETLAAAEAAALLESPLTRVKRNVSGLIVVPESAGPGRWWGHWYVLAIVPVAALASLLAVRAGLNPYALCLEWWDLLFGSVFFVACLAFLGFAVFRGARGRWHPGIPALVVALCVLPFWLGANAAFHSACEEIPLEPTLLPPLPPPIEVPTVPNMWPAPLPQPRPPGL